MRHRIVTILATLVLCLAPAASWANLTPYSQDFEGLVPAPQELPETSLGGDGWSAFGNVFGPDWSYWYGYGAFVAPNHGQAFSAVVTGEGGAAQGDQQLSVFSDYYNDNHGDGAYIESNIFREQTIGAADVGSVWRFDFDAKRGDLAGGSVAKAFFKTLNPANWALTNFITVDMTATPVAWTSYSLSIYIDPGLEGQILQFGFLSIATQYEPSGVYYDNVNFDLAPIGVALDIRPGGCPNPINPTSQGVLSVAVLSSAAFDAAAIDPASLRLEGVAPLRWSQDDVAAPYSGDLCGCSESGMDGYADLMLHFSTQEIVAAIGSMMRSGDLELTLTGALFDGRSIEGSDCVVVVGGRRPVDVEVEGAGGAGLQDIRLGGTGVGNKTQSTVDPAAGDGARKSFSRRLRNRVE